MKKWFFGILAVLALFATAAFAQELPPEPSFGEWLALLKSIGGLKGASAMAIVAALVQALMLLVRSKLGDVAGKWRLALVYLLTMVGGIAAMMLTGIDLVAALTHANTLAAFQVFLHQIVKQIREDKKAKG